MIFGSNKKKNLFCAFLYDSIKIIKNQKISKLFLKNSKNKIFYIFKDEKTKLSLICLRLPSFLHF